MAAGQVAGLIEDLLSCAELVNRVMSEAEETMAELGAVTPERTPTNNKLAVYTFTCTLWSCPSL